MLSLFFIFSAGIQRRSYLGGKRCVSAFDFMFGVITPGSLYGCQRVIRTSGKDEDRMFFKSTKTRLTTCRRFEAELKTFTWQHATRDDSIPQCKNQFTLLGLNSLPKADIFLSPNKKRGARASTCIAHIASDTLQRRKQRVGLSTSATTLSVVHL